MLSRGSNGEIPKNKMERPDDIPVFTEMLFLQNNNKDKRLPNGLAAIARGKHSFIQHAFNRTLVRLFLDRSREPSYVRQGRQASISKAREY